MYMSKIHGHKIEVVLYIVYMYIIVAAPIIYMYNTALYTWHDYVCVHISLYITHAGERKEKKIDKKKGERKMYV